MKGREEGGSDAMCQVPYQDNLVATLQFTRVRLSMPRLPPIKCPETLVVPVKDGEEGQLSGLPDILEQLSEVCCLIATTISIYKLVLRDPSQSA